MAELVSWTGLVIILYSVVSFDVHTAFPGACALLPCLGAAAVIASNTEGLTTVGRLLSLRPVVFVGLISYSLYLWHWPLFAYAHYLAVTDLSLVLRWALVVSSFALAAGAWRLVEMPFRRKRVFPSRRGVFAFAAAGLLASVGAGAATHGMGGFRERFSAEVLGYADGRRDRSPLRSETFNVPVAAIGKNGLPRIGVRDDTASPSVMVIGDSHADALMPAFELLFRNSGVSAVVANRQATIPLFGAYEVGAGGEGKGAFHRAVRKALSREATIRHAILIARWSAYDEQLTDLTLFNGMVDYLATNGIKVWVVRQVPEPVTEIPRGMALAVRFGREASSLGISYERFMKSRARLNAVLEQLQAERSGVVSIVDPASWFFPDKTNGRVHLNGRVLYTDDDHLSAFGARQLEPVLKLAFEPLIADVSGDNVRATSELRRIQR